MGDEYDRQRHHDRVLATMYRLDPEKLAAVRRATTGMTRCPECDTLNPADQRRCYKCGSKLYYDLLDEEEPKDKSKSDEDETRSDKEAGPDTSTGKPPYY